MLLCGLFPFFYVDFSGYSIPADIRMNKDGRQNLFYNGFKYSRDGWGVTKQRWVCTCKNSKKCKSSISTVKIDGVAMIKVLIAEHTHEPIE